MILASWMVLVPEMLQVPYQLFLKIYFTFILPGETD